MPQLTGEQLERMAKAIYDELGSDHREDVYKHALLVELRVGGFTYSCEQAVEIRYKNQHVGWGYADILVDSEPQGRILLELKKNAKIANADLQQARNYMKQLEVEHGFVVNFGFSGTGKTFPEVKVQSVTLTANRQS